ncbi:MAG: multicopper oxidase domain-containing protein [Propionibacteriaceae bacterium]|nr:multicopper oxidase domain-containing protein [Propionibacteriaceae bacterium]
MSEPTFPLPEPDSLEHAFLAATGSAPPPVVDVEATPLPPVEEASDLTPRAGAATELPRLDVDAAHDDGPGKTRPPFPTPLPGIDSGLSLKKFRDRLVIPPVIRAWRRPQDAAIRIRAEVARVRLHADLPEAEVWTYEGTSPGPTIEVQRDRPVRIDWVNGLGRPDHPAHLPYAVVRVPPLENVPGFNANVAAAAAPGGRSIERAPGSDSYPVLANTDHVTGHTVVHLHGALTDGHNDGWAHNVAAPGGITRCTYPNRQPSATLWYHDHAMAVTRYNVHAGLAGFYLIRDRNESMLRLPSGEAEIPLMIADRNLETDPTPEGEPLRFTGRLLYKQAGFSFGPAAPIGELPVTGPYAFVNGKIWPTHRVDARWHRLRILNASNARIMRLALHDTTDEVFEPGTPVRSTDPNFGVRRVDALVVIGTDGGLLPAPHRPSGGVVEIGPGERLDVLVDFGQFRGRTLELRNENGTALNAQPGQADASLVQFVVDRRKVLDRWQLPALLNPEYSRWEHLSDGTLKVGNEIVPHHQHAWVAVIPPGLRGSMHPELWELAEHHTEPGVDLPATDLIAVTQNNGSVTYLKPVAKLFDDATTIVIPRGDWAVWHILHLGGPDHPMHIHMTEFQMIARRQWPIPNQGGTVPEFDTSTGSTRTPLPVPGPGREIDRGTAGMKDTWVVKAGEWVSVLGHFDGASGSFMYHCHILDHEDFTMMRPFVVLPPELLAFHGAHGDGHH